MVRLFYSVRKEYSHGLSNRRLLGYSLCMLMYIWLSIFQTDIFVSVYIETHIGAHREYTYTNLIDFSALYSLLLEAL